MVHTGQTARWIRYLNEDFILILSSSSTITNKPDHSHMLCYSLMHVTSVMCSIVFSPAPMCVCVQCTQWTIFMCYFLSVHSCKSTTFPLLEPCQSSRPRSHCCCMIMYFHSNAFAVFNTLLYFHTITDSDSGAPRMPLFPVC